MGGRGYHSEGKSSTVLSAYCMSAVWLGSPLVSSAGSGIGVSPEGLVPLPWLEAGLSPEGLVAPPWSETGLSPEGLVAPVPLAALP